MKNGKKRNTEMQPPSHLFIYALAHQLELTNFLKSNCHESETDRAEDLLASWQAVQDLARLLAVEEKDEALSISLKPVPAQHNRLLKQYSSDLMFQKTFSRLKTEFALVEIDKLIAAQKSVNLAHCQRLIEEVKGNLGMRDLIKLCLSPGRMRQEVQHLELASDHHIFTSPDPDIRYLGSFLKPIESNDWDYTGGGYPVAAIISFIGYGGAPVNALKVGPRLVLNNGFHRVYALRALGIKEIPIVIQHVHNPLLEFPASINGIPRDLLLATPRPALVKDFFDPRLTIQLRSKQKLKAVKLQIVQNGFEVPC